MSQAERIARLDAALAEAGSTITLQRVGPSSGSVVVLGAVDCPAAVRPVGRSMADGLAGSVAMSDDHIIISPTPLVVAGWTSGRAGSGEEIVPMKGNRVLIGGRQRTIDSATAIRVQGEIVRIEMLVVG